jgi:hypothetical protein
MPTENEKKWIAAWKFAGPELERIRNEELRQMTDEEGLQSLGAFETENLTEDSQRNGLITFQSWMMRMRILEMLGRIPKTKTKGSSD